MDYTDCDIARSEVIDFDVAVFPLGRAIKTARPGARQAVVAVVEDGVWMSRALEEICEFLDIVVARVPGECDLGMVLDRHKPMAVVCALEGEPQDGFHVMKTVAQHDPSLPVMVVTGDDPALMGAADAVEEIWRLTEVTMLPSLPGIAGLVDFLFLAGRQGNCMRLPAV